MRAVGIAALAASFVVHLGGLHVFTATEPTKIAGGNTVEVARLGNSFQDIAVGQVAPATTPTAVKPAVSPTPVPNTVTSSTSAVSPTTPVTSSSVQTRTVTANTTQSVTATEPVSVQTPVPETPRPRTRSERQPERQRTPQRTQRRPASEQQPQGQSRAERRGQSDGQQQARATQGSNRNRGAATTQGNAAVSNYPGQVMRKISRTRRPRAGQRGSAVVAFNVSANGGLASVQIVRSSGNSQIDRAALQHIRRAAPFPPPPQGAQRRFQVRYDSR